MHSTAFKDGLEEDMTICLGVNDKGSMVCWKAYNTEERLSIGNIGWGSGTYHPNRGGNILNLDNSENRALTAFKDAIKWEIDSCVARTKTVSEDATKASSSAPKSVFTPRWNKDAPDVVAEFGREFMKGDKHEE
jgi:hypothetical protein